MKRLAIVITHPIQYYAPLFRALHERGKITIHVFYTWGEQSVSKYDPGFGKKIDWDIPTLEGYPFSWLKNKAKDPGTHHFRGIIAPDLVGVVSAWKPDAVLFFGWAWQAHLSGMRYFKGKLPVYFRGDSTLLNTGHAIKKVLRSVFLKWVYRHADKALYVGMNNRAYYKAYGLTEGQLVFAPHAADNERFYAAGIEDGEALRTGLGVPAEAIVVLYAGKFEPVKNVALLLRAFLKSGNPGVHLVLVGNGPLEDALRRPAVDSQYIHFLGFQNQSAMPAIYQACDLFCLPSQSETWGLSVNEAMASGKAVLVSDKAGCAIDLVKESYNGAIFESGNIDSLVSRLTLLTKDKEELARMGHHSREIIAEWSFTRIAEAIEKTVNGNHERH